MNEYADLAAQVGSIEAAINAVARGYRARYVPPGGPGQWARAFGAFCAAAYDLAPRVGGLWVVVEELADVTTASHAPPAWARITRSGRHRGITLLAATQRPATVDKSFLGNASLIRCFRLNWRTDTRILAAVLAVQESELIALKPGQWVERNMLTGMVTRGCLS